MEDTKTNSTSHAKVSSDLREDARILLAAQRAVLDVYERTFTTGIFTQQIAHAHEWLAAMEPWLSGGDAPTFAQDVTPSCSKRDDRGACDCAECAAVAELELKFWPLDNIADGLQSVMSWSSGSSSWVKLDTAFEEMLAYARETKELAAFSDEEQECFTGDLSSAAHDAAELASGGDNYDHDGFDSAFEQRRSESEQRVKMLEGFRGLAESTRAAIRDDSVYSIFAVDEDGFLPGDVHEAAQNENAASPTARRLQVLMAEAMQGGASVEAYLGTLCAWASILLKRLPANTNAAHRSVLSNTLELSMEFARGSRSPAIRSALNALFQQADAFDYEDPAVVVAERIANIDWSGDECCQGPAESGWADAAIVLGCLAEVTSLTELEPTMTACASIAYRNFFKAPHNDNARATRRSA